MARPRSPQLNIRSDFARERVALISERTGMTTVQVVEEALRAYTPPPRQEAPAGLVERGGLLFKPARGQRISVEEAQAAIEAAREERDAWVALKP